MNCSVCRNAKRRTRVGANILRREIRPCLRIGCPSDFVRSFHSHTQDDRGGMFCCVRCCGMSKSVFYYKMIAHNFGTGA